MPQLAVFPRQFVSGAYARIVTSVTMLCRLGALLAFLQLTAWIGAWSMAPGQTTSERLAITQERITAVESVLDPAIVGVVHASPFAELEPVGRVESALGTIRELSRTLLWGLVVVLLPIAITVGLLAPFVRGEDGFRMLFGMIAVLGMLPLTAAEAAPVIGVDYTTVAMPESILAGLAAPLVAGILLMSAAVLFSSRIRGSGAGTCAGSGQHISPSELETIIRRGERPSRGRNVQLKSSRSRRKTQ